MKSRLINEEKQRKQRLTMFRWSRKASQKRRHLTQVLKDENFVEKCFPKVKAEHKRRTTEKNTQWDTVSRMLGVKNSLISDNGGLWLTFREISEIKYGLCSSKTVLEACKGWHVHRKASTSSGEILLVRLSGQPEHDIPFQVHLLFYMLKTWSLLFPHRCHHLPLKSIT